MKKISAVILAGGEGSRLGVLTAKRTKPAVPFGGSYRIIDFTLSNCIHSGLRRIFVLTQYQAYSLEEHLRLAWNFLPRRLTQFIAARPPQHHDIASNRCGKSQHLRPGRSRPGPDWRRFPRMGFQRLRQRYQHGLRQHRRWIGQLPPGWNSPTFLLLPN